MNRSGQVINTCQIEKGRMNGEKVEDVRTEKNEQVLTKISHFIMGESFIIVDWRCCHW